MSRPNILIVMGDQHRMDCLGAYGNHEIKTPHLDELASDGIIYDNSFCAAPICTPSRYSFLTGLYPHQHQGYTNHCTIPKGIDTFPQLLKQSGYRTKAVGKMHFTPTYLDVGFEQMSLSEQNGDGRFHDDYHQYLRDHGLVDAVDLMDQESEYRKKAPQHYWDTYGAMVSNLPEKHHSTTWIAERAIESIEQWDSKGDRQLLMVSFIKPHHPFDPPESWSEMYEPSQLSLLPGWTDTSLEQDLSFIPGYFSNESLTVKQLKKVMAYYYACISQIDFQVGRMIDLLKEKGLYDDTIIIYTSDHGEYMGFHHMLLKGNHMYDPLVKVPLIIKYPKQMNAGTRCQDLVSNIDLAPTICRMAQCPVGEYMSGEDITQELTNRNHVFAQYGRGEQYMVRSKRYKLLLNLDPIHNQFFDLEQDPYELNNCYTDPEFSNEITHLKEALYDMILFKAYPPVHFDAEARCISDDKDAHPDLSEWVRSQMRQYYESSEW